MSKAPTVTNRPSKPAVSVISRHGVTQRYWGQGNWGQGNWNGVSTMQAPEVSIYRSAPGVRVV